MDKMNKERGVSRRDFIRGSVALAMAAGASACIPIRAGDPPDRIIPTKVSPSETSTPFPDGSFIANGEVSLNVVKDSASLKSEVDSFNRSEVNWYDDSDLLQTKSGNESGFILLGALDVQIDNDLDASTLGYVTSAGGKEHIAQKLNNDRWIILSFKQLDEPTGDTLNAFGYASKSFFLPILSVEYSAEGQPTGDEWFFDVSVNRFYKVNDAEGKGKEGMLSLVQIGNESVLKGKNIMQDYPDKNWNFAWDTDNQLTIKTDNGRLLFYYKEEDKKWVEIKPAITDPNAPEKVKNIENITGLVMTKGEGDYYVFAGDTKETYRVPINPSEFDELSWTINGQEVALKNLSQDIIDKGVNTNGDKVVWVSGWSATKDSVTGEIKWDLVAVERPHGKEEAGNVLPHFTRFSDSRLDLIANQNLQKYEDAVNEKYPVEDLFDSEILASVYPTNFEVINAYAFRGIKFYTFFPQSNDPDNPRSLWIYHQGKYSNATPDSPTGSKSPYQFQKIGLVYSPMPAEYDPSGNDWGALVWPMIIINTPSGNDNKGIRFLRILCFEDEIARDTATNKSNIAEAYDKILNPLSAPLPTLILPWGNNQSQLHSVRMGKFLVKGDEQALSLLKKYRIKGESLIWPPGASLFIPDRFVVSQLPAEFKDIPFNILPLYGDGKF